MSQTTTDIVDHEETEELLDHAEESLTGVILGTITFLKGRQLSVSDWAAHLGSQVAPTWEENKGKGAREIARLVAINVIAAGGDVHGLSGDDGRAELRCSWPDAEDLAYFKLTRDDIDPFLQLYQPIISSLGLRYEAHREGDQATLTFTR
jgi:hypothetical protein